MLEAYKLFMLYIGANAVSWKKVQNSFCEKCTACRVEKQ